MSSIHTMSQRQCQKWPHRWGLCRSRSRWHNEQIHLLPQNPLLASWKNWRCHRGYRAVWMDLCMSTLTRLHGEYDECTGKNPYRVIWRIQWRRHSRVNSCISGIHILKINLYCCKYVYQNTRHRILLAFKNSYCLNNYKKTSSWMRTVHLPTVRASKWTSWGGRQGAGMKHCIIHFQNLCSE